MDLCKCLHVAKVKGEAEEVDIKVEKGVDIKPDTEIEDQSLSESKPVVDLSGYETVNKSEKVEKDEDVADLITKADIEIEEHSFSESKPVVDLSDHGSVNKLEKGADLITKHDIEIEEHSFSDLPDHGSVNKLEKGNDVDVADFLIKDDIEDEIPLLVYQPIVDLIVYEITGEEEQKMEEVQSAITENDLDTESGPVMDLDVITSNESDKDEFRCQPLLVNITTDKTVERRIREKITKDSGKLVVNIEVDKILEERISEYISRDGVTKKQQKTDSRSGNKRTKRCQKVLEHGSSVTRQGKSCRRPKDKHTKESNGSWKLFFCTYCDFSTYYNHNLTSHIRRVHKKGRELLTCTNCDFSTTSEYHLDRHMSKHNKERGVMFFCYNCEFKTFYKRYLREHILNMHLRTGRYVCCDKLFKNKSTLDNHLLKKHRDLVGLVSSKIHKCATCSFETTNKSNLNLHNTIVHHSKEDAPCYKCNICQYVTYHRSNFKTHQDTVHSQVRRFVCLACLKGFKHKRQLDIHIFNEHSYNDHLMRTITYKIHSCELCSFESLRTTDLKLHVKKVHNIIVMTENETSK